MKEEIAKIISNEAQVPLNEILPVIEIPMKEFGDYAFPCFVLSKTFKKNPVDIAKELSDKLNKGKYKGIYLIEHRGPYVNFFIDRRVFSYGVLENIEKENLQKKKKEKKKSIVIEFSQPNTHKAFHVGHIRGTSIGESLARIFEFNGYKVVRVNYSGDTGLHIAKWIWCYTKYHKKEKLRDDESWIASIYVDASKKLSQNKELEKEVNEINFKLSEGKDKKLNKLWKDSRKLSIKSWKKIYDELNTHFDKHYFESEVEKEGKIIAEDLLKKGIAQKDDAIFINLDEYELGVWVLIRRDGTVLYSAKDLALAYKKVKDIKSDEYLVIVGDEQKSHFNQLIKTLELMKFSKKDNYNFMTFAMVRLPQGKMSSRTGDNVLYSDFLEEVTEIAREGIEKRKREKKEIEKRAKLISLAAIKYSMLKQDPNKVIIFDPKIAISFEGDTGPYLLYSYARANSILKKVRAFEKIKIKDLEIPYITDSENELIKKINSFDEVVEKAYLQKAPNLIANYALELSKLFNEFYHELTVVGSEQEKFRAKLVEAFMRTLKKSCDLMGIDVLEEM